MAAEPAASCVVKSEIKQRHGECQPSQLSPTCGVLVCSRRAAAESFDNHDRR